MRLLRSTDGFYYYFNCKLEGNNANCVNRKREFCSSAIHECPYAEAVKVDTNVNSKNSTTRK